MNSETDQKIRELRQAGLTVREIAQRVGKSYQWVSRVTRAMEKPALTLTIDKQGRTVVEGDLEPRQLATHVMRALKRTADVTYTRDD